MNNGPTPGPAQEVRRKLLDWARCLGVLLAIIIGLLVVIILELRGVI